MTDMNTTLLLDETKDDQLHLEFGPMLPRPGAHRTKCRIFMSIKQGMRCHYCRTQMSLERIEGCDKQRANTATFEHLIDEWSSVDGKDDRLENIVMACYGCNKDRNRHRQTEVQKFYAAKFPSKQLYTAFVKAAKPSDFIKMFGVAPDTWTPSR